MKNQVYFFLIALELVSITASCNNSTHPTQKTDRILPSVKNTVSEKIVFSGTIVPIQQVVTSPTDGIIESIDINDGAFIHPRKVLFHFDNYEQFQALKKEKELLKSSFLQAFTAIPVSLSSVKMKWELFTNAIVMDAPLPAFPAIEFKEEHDWLTQTGTYAQLKKVVILEKDYRTSFVVSKHSGIIQLLNIHKGSRIKKGQILAKIHPIHQGDLTTKHELNILDTLLIGTYQAVVIEKKEHYSYRVQLPFTPLTSTMVQCELLNPTR
jgi:multidrug efflux pump subunit AcrA (membrane-fusion protein)